MDLSGNSILPTSKGTTTIDHVRQDKPSDMRAYTTNALYSKMDDNNKKAIDVMATKGMDAAVKHMFTHPSTGKPMTYSQMRHFYG